MDSLLVGVTLVSLVLAAAMAAVAWGLLGDGRRRSAARVEALAALASRGDAESEPDEDEAAWDADLPADAAEHVMFGDASDPGPGRRRWVAVTAVALVLALGVGTLYAARQYGILTRADAAQPSAGPTALAGARPLELVSLRHSIDDAGYFTITGLVQEPAEGQPVRDVIAVVYLFDAEGHQFASGRMRIDFATLHPGEESPFKVRIPAAAGVSRYRVGFRLPDGGVIAHIDKRASAAGVSGI
jgi:hypothetical protein